jgi:hypothetical protein
MRHFGPRIASSKMLERTGKKGVYYDICGQNHEITPGEGHAGQGDGGSGISVNSRRMYQDPGGG